MVRLAFPVFAIALLAGSALAQSSEAYEREVAENDIYGRVFNNADDLVVAREDLEALFGREFVNDIEERSPFGLGLLFKGVKAAVKLGTKAHHAHQSNHKRSFDQDEFYVRELDSELDEREPFGLGLIFKGVKAAVKLAKGAHHAHDAASNHHKREVDLLEDDVFERGFDDDEDFFEREFSDMEEREYYDELD